jgi:hypothetical protein
MITTVSEKRVVGLDLPPKPSDVKSSLLGKAL